MEYDPETQIFRDALENAMQEEEDPETAIFRDALENALQEDDMHFMARDALEKALEMEEKPDQMDQTQRPAAQVPQAYRDIQAMHKRIKSWLSVFCLVDVIHHVHTLTPIALSCSPCSHSAL